MKKLLLSLALSMGFLSLAANDEAYLFSYFVGQSDGLHLAYSLDGLTWTPLNGGGSMLVPTIGDDKLMRDPSIVQGPDGTFHLVWTSSWTDRIIGYASSPDLIHWSEQRAIPVMMHEPEAHNCWAPELFYDAPSATYYIYWATTIPGRHSEVATSEREKGLNHRIYCTTTQDFEHFTETRLFFNPDFSVIDAAIAKDPTTEELIMVVKNENSNPPEKNLRVTRSKDIAQGFPTNVSASITGDYWCEGPAPLFVGDTLYVYFDKYRNHTYGAVRSLDHGETWEDISDMVSFPEGARHGTAFKVKRAVLDKLRQLHRYNPIIPDHIADPSVSKFGDTFYLYATTDLDRGLSMAGTPVVWQSKDFVNWSFCGTHITEYDWRTPHTVTNDKGEERQGYYRFWAPGKVIEKDGVYHLYATIVTPDDDLRTYLFTADNPLGPYTQQGEVTPDIDGEPFVDDDGSAYIFWRHRQASAMSSDLQHLTGETITMETGRSGYSEGPLMFKRNGIYYYIYTLRGHQNYANAYMMSKESPLTAFEKPVGNDIFLFSAVENNVWGPGHGNVFFDEESDTYLFLYLEYGDGGTTRRVYANRMEFNEDGTIRTLIPDEYGIGYLAPATETRPNLALGAKCTASSTATPRTTEVTIETQPNAPLPEKGSEMKVARTHAYNAANAIDNWYGSCWMAAADDAAPTLTIDFGVLKQVGECQLFFVHPTEGHTWHIEKSTDGEHWEICVQQTEEAVRSPHIATVNDTIKQLRLHINSGAGGLWEWKIYE